MGAYSRNLTLGLLPAFLICCATVSSSSAQITFEGAYGWSEDDEAYAVTQTVDGGYAIAGYKYTYGVGWETCLIRTDSIGDTIWTHTFGRGTGYSVEQTQDSGLIVAGYGYASGYNRRVHLVRTDFFGDTLWTRMFGDPNSGNAYSVCETHDRGYIVVGSVNSDALYLIRTDSNGDTLWSKVYGWTPSDIGRSVQETEDLGYIIAGETYSSASASDDVLLVKTDSLGEVIWSRAYGGSEGDYGYSARQTPDGGYIIAGYTRSFGAGGTDVYLVRTDSLGDTLWTRTYGGTSNDWGFAVHETEDGGCVVAGETSSFGTGPYDLYLVRVDSLGDTLWTRTYGGSSSESGRSVRQTQDGGFVVGGHTYSFGAGRYDFYLVKTDSLGMILPEADIGITSLDTPLDTVFLDSSYEVRATVANLGNVCCEFEAFAAVDGYADTTAVRGPGPGYAKEITFKEWSIPHFDSTTYVLAVCAKAPGDIDSTNDCAQAPIFARDGQGPVMLTAVASDNANPVPGIDDDDYVLIAFDDPTNKPFLDASNIDSVLMLSWWHSWKDGFGTIGSATWNSWGDTLLIALSTYVSPPTVVVDDIIKPDEKTIQDEWGNITMSRVIITGTFDPPVGTEAEGRRDEPRAFCLLQNRPNPFHHCTRISYSIPAQPSSDLTHVRLTIQDAAGRLVRTLVEECQAPGVYRIRWDAGNHPSGIYFCHIKAGNFTGVKKLTLLR